MVVSQGRRMVSSSVCLCRLVGLLRQHRHDKCNDRLVCSLDTLRLDFRRDLRSAAVSCLEAQSFWLPDAVRSVGQILHLRAVWHSERTSPPIKTLTGLCFRQLVRSLTLDDHYAGHGLEILDLFSKRWGPDGLSAAGEGSLRFLFVNPFELNAKDYRNKMQPVQESVPFLCSRMLS